MNDPLQELNNTENCEKKGGCPVERLGLLAMFRDSGRGGSNLAVEESAAKLRELYAELDLCGRCVGGVAGKER